MKRMSSSVAVLVLIGLAGCGGGGGDGNAVGNDPAGGGNDNPSPGTTTPAPSPAPGPSPAPAPGPAPSPNPAPTPQPGPAPAPNPSPSPASSVSLSEASGATPMESALNQTFDCVATNTRFTLAVDPDGQAAVQLSDNSIVRGQYAVANDQLNLTLEDGSTASSQAYGAVPGLVVGMRLVDAAGTTYACIARAHFVGDRLNEQERIRCGQRNLTGRAENTFTLNPDGSASWQNVYELPGGVDTLFESRIGTYVLDLTRGAISMAFKDVGATENVRFLDALIAADGRVEFVLAPASGTGSRIEANSCRVL